MATSKVEPDRPKREKTGGRVKGVPNKANRTLREAAREYTDSALDVLATIMTTTTEPSSARVAAANAILDRGYGKPSQPVDGDGEGGAIQLAHKINLIGVAPGDS